MSNSIKNHQEEWCEIIKMYELFRRSDDSYQPMLELARWLADSPYSSRIRASTSHAILSLSAQETSRRGQWQTVRVYFYGDEFRVEFFRYEADGGSAKLPRDYAADEIRAAIGAWLWRLKVEAVRFG